MERGVSLRKIAVQYLCIGYVISLLFSEVSGFLYALSGLGDIENEVFADWVEFGKGSRLDEIAGWGGFALPVASMIFYAFPLFRGKRTSLSDRRILNTPLAAALFVLLGWLFNFVIRFGLALSVHLSGERNLLSVLLIFPLSTVITALPPIMLTYLALEVFNRMAVLPRLFPDGSIFSVKGAVKPSLSMVLIVSSYWVRFFPCAYWLAGTKTSNMFWPARNSSSPFDLAMTVPEATVSFVPPSP